MKSKLISIAVISSSLLFMSLGSIIISAMSISMTMMALWTWIRLFCLLLLFILILLSLFSCTLSFSISSISFLLLILLFLLTTWFARALNFGRSRIRSIFVITFRITLSLGCLLIMCLLIGFWGCSLFGLR